MSSYFEYMAIYETGLLVGSPQKIVVDPLKIELLPLLPRQFAVAEFGPHTSAIGTDAMIAQQAHLQLLPQRRYIILTARTAESDPFRARRACEDEVNRGTTALAALVSPVAIGKLVHRMGYQPTWSYHRGMGSKSRAGESSKREPGDRPSCHHEPRKS